MRKEPHFEWDENLGQATCIIEDSQQRVFFGLATCHGDDMDMKSRRTGEEIAFRRARMDYLRQQRDDILLELKALKQLYYSMNQSKRFNPKSYENTMSHDSSNSQTAYTILLYYAIDNDDKRTRRTANLHL